MRIVPCITISACNCTPANLQISSHSPQSVGSPALARGDWRAALWSSALGGAWQSLTQWARARRWEGPVQGWGGWLVTRPAEWCRWRQWRHCWHSTFSNWRVVALFIRTRHILFETILRFSFHLFCLTRSIPCHANHAKSYCVYMFVDMSMFSDYTLKLTLQPNPIWSNL